MSDMGGDRRSWLATPPDQEVASRMALLAALALVAGVLLGVFAAIVVVVGGLALLAMAAAARVNRSTAPRRRRSAGRARAAAADDSPPTPAVKQPTRRATGPRVPRATH